MVSMSDLVNQSNYWESIVSISRISNIIGSMEGTFYGHGFGVSMKQIVTAIASSYSFTLGG